MGGYDAAADLYDVAFSFDLADEVDWVIERLGGSLEEILEPACGTGRTFIPYSRRGVTVTGVDISEVMLERARRRLAEAGLPEPPLHRADIAEFDLGRTFDGAICPINSFGHLLTREAALSHLRCVARHLLPGGRYLLQVDLHDLHEYSPPEPDVTTAWEEERDGLHVKALFQGISFDPATSIEKQLMRLEVIDGPGKGRVEEAHHEQRLWDYAGWSGLIGDSPFEQVEAYSGMKGRAPVEVGPALEHTRLAWHVLERRE